MSLAPSTNREWLQHMANEEDKQCINIGMPDVDEFIEQNPQLAVWRGSPSMEKIRQIKLRTRTDSEGKLFFMRMNGSWKRLIEQADYDELNKIIVERHVWPTGR